MSKASERRAARREARAARREERQSFRLAKQEKRQGFLSNMIGEGGLGGLIETGGKVFGGGGGDDLPLPATGGSKNLDGEGGQGFDVMKFLPIIAIAGFLLLKKK